MGNVLRELTGTRYEHDAYGNLVQRVERDGATWRYEYDAANRLTQASRHAREPAANERLRTEDAASPTLQVRFAYDAFGWRTQKAVEHPDRTVEQTLFTWDGDVLLMEERFVRPPPRPGEYQPFQFRRVSVVREDADDEYSLPVAQRMHTLDEACQWQGASLYLHEPGSFVPLARLDEMLVEPAFLTTGTDGQFVQVPAKTRHATLFYQNDHLGTPQELVDETGKVVWLARYKAWGGLKASRKTDDPAEAGNAIRFPGQYHDVETGLHYNRHRYYDPDCGRFISKDPIGLAGGINVYYYAPNPLGWIDPLGLAIVSNAPDFDTARRQAFERAGMNNPVNVSFSKMDPTTGTVVEFKGKGGAKVAYDAPHADMDSTQGHDKPHVGWQTAGKRGCGCERGNITYKGQQHPHRPDQKP